MPKQKVKLFKKAVRDEILLAPGVEDLLVSVGEKMKGNISGDGAKVSVERVPNRTSRVAVRVLVDGVTPEMRKNHTIEKAARG